MAAVASEGLIYLWQSEQSTASITPKNEVREFIDRVPRATCPGGRGLLSLREVRTMNCDTDDQEPSNLIVARTFSKIYGMAGLRCGYCIAQSETIRAPPAASGLGQREYMALVAATPVWVTPIR